MGLCVSSENGEARRLHADAEQQLKKAKRQMKKQAKILLLGSGDSGKTTIMKQMRLITNTSFTRTELESYRQLVFTNLVNGMRAIVESLPEIDLYIEDDEAALTIYEHIEIAPDIKDGEPFPIEYLEYFKTLWTHPLIQEGMNHCRQFAIPDNVPYFFGSLDRVFQPNYRPTNSDIVHTRARTVGIVETIFRVSDSLTSHTPPDPNAVPTFAGEKSTGASGTVKSMRSSSKSITSEFEISEKSIAPIVKPAGASDLHFVDVGGQRSERRKWIHCFQDVTAILFLVSLSGYDQCLVEEKSTNQMSDAMTIWEGICTMEWFKHTNLILFLNKEDLFRQKLPTSPIKRFFPDYDGPVDDIEAGKQYFKRRFTKLAYKGLAIQSQDQKKQDGARKKKTSNPQRIERRLYHHFTTAINTTLVQSVMGVVADIVLRDHLATSALL